MLPSAAASFSRRVLAGHTGGTVGLAGSRAVATEPTIVDQLKEAGHKAGGVGQGVEARSGRGCPRMTRRQPAPAARLHAPRSAPLRSGPDMDGACNLALQVGDAVSGAAERIKEGIVGAGHNVQEVRGAAICAQARVRRPTAHAGSTSTWRAV